MGEITDLARYEFPQGNVLLIALEDWDEWIPVFDGVRVLRSDMLTEYRLILLVSKPYVDTLVEDGRYQKYVKALGWMAQDLVQQEPETP